MNNKLLHEYIYLDEFLDIYIHESIVTTFLITTYPDYHKKLSITEKINNLFNIESRYVTIDGQKYYHERFIKKLLNLKN